MNSALTTARNRRVKATRGVARQPPSSDHVRLMSGVLWVVVISGLSQGSTFLAAILSARLLGSQEFGQLALIQSVLVVAGSFAGMGLGVTATKIVAELRQRDPDRVGRVLGLCVLVAATAGLVYMTGLYVSAEWVARDLFKTGQLATQLRIGAVYALLSSLNAFQVGALTGFEAFSHVARLSAWQGLATLVLTIGLTWALGLTGGVLALVAVMACSWILFQRALRAECRRHGIQIRFTGLRGELPVLTRLALPAAASGCVGGLAISGANAMLIRQPGGFTEMAVFNAANCFRMLVLLAPAMVARVSTPILCSLRASNDLSRYGRLLRVCLASNVALAAAAATLLSLLADPLLRLFGKDFSQGRNAFALLMVAAVVEVVGVTLYQPLFIHGRLWVQFGIITVWSGVLVGGVWYGAATGGAAALATSYLAAWCFSAAAYGMTARRLGQAHVPPCAAATVSVS